MQKRVFFTLVSIFFIVALALWYVVSRPEQESSATPKVIASFYPVYEFTRAVGGDAITVENIAGNSVSPHDFEPSAQDVVTIESADLFVYNGAGLDPWGDDLAPELKQQGKRTLNLSTFVSLRDATGDHDHDDEAGHENEEGTEHEEEAEHEHGAKDPHIWLDPVNAQVMVRAIQEELVVMYPEHAEVFAANADTYVAKLEQLNQDIAAGLANCERSTIVVSHNAFSYFAERYNLDSVAIAGLSPTSEPSARELAEITEVVREKGVTHIFFESLVSPKLAETLAAETGIKTLALEPAAGISEARQAQGENYISVMRSNLVNLQNALQCQE